MIPARAAIYHVEDNKVVHKRQVLFDNVVEVVGKRYRRDRLWFWLSPTAALSTRLHNRINHIEYSHRNTDALEQLL